MRSAFGVEHVGKAWGEMVHVGAHQVGRGLGSSARQAKKTRDGAFRVTTDAPKGPRNFPRRVEYHPSRGARAVAGAAPLVALGAGGSEVNRRSSNKHGAGVGPVEQFGHPIRSRNKEMAARHRHVAQVADARAGRRAAAGKPRSAAFHARVANVSNFASETHSARALHGEVRGNKHGPGRYDKTKRYNVPAAIGKSAFGVEHVGKLAPVQAVGAVGNPSALVRDKKLLPEQPVPSAAKKIKAKLAPIAAAPTMPE
jgi:hypothetical protein